MKLRAHYPPINEKVVKTLLDIGNLSVNSQKTYSKCLKRLGKYANARAQLTIYILGQIIPKKL